MPSEIFPEPRRKLSRPSGKFRPADILGARATLFPLGGGKVSVGRASRATSVCRDMMVCAFSVIAARIPQRGPRMLAACARKPTNYFRVYKINERSVADETRVPPRPLSLAAGLLLAREHNGVCGWKKRKREEERERETPRCISKYFPRGRCRLCVFRNNGPGPAQVLLTEPPRSTEGSPPDM